MRSLVLASTFLALLAACSSSPGSPDAPVTPDNTTAGGPAPNDDPTTSITIGVDSEDFNSEVIPSATMEVTTSSSRSR